MNDVYEQYNQDRV